MEFNPNAPFGSGSVLAEERGNKRYWKQNRPDLHPIRCLIVDDNKAILRYVASMLAMLGFDNLEIAQNLLEVTKRLIAGPYELLVTNLEMPDMNGYDLAQKMKKNDHDIKTIIMTGRQVDDCLEMMTTRWVDGWLFKPFGLNKLRSMLFFLGVI